MTEKEFDKLKAVISLSTCCHTLRNLYEDLRDDIPDELQDLFIQLKVELDDLRNPIYDYIISHANIH